MLYRSVNNYISEKNFSEADKFLGSKSSILSAKDYKELREYLYLNELLDIVKNEQFEIALQAVKNKQKDISSKDYTSLLTQLYTQEANKLALNSQWLEAAALMERGLQDSKNNSTFTRNRNTFRQNFAASVHNEAVVLINSGRIEEAKAIIERGLQQFPESTVLKNDLQRLRN